MKRKFSIFQPKKRPEDLSVRKSFENLDVSKLDNEIVYLQANAGGGKTHSVINFLKKHPEWDILCLSHTRAATAEMSKRLRNNNGKVTFSTFDAMAKRNMKYLVQGLRICPQHITSLTYFHTLMKDFHRHKCELLEYLRMKRPMENFYMSRRLIAEEYCGKSYDIVIVDEAQDLDKNAIKFLTKHMEGNKAKIFVGDPKQAIYQDYSIFKNPTNMTFKFTHTFRYDGELIDFINECSPEKHTSFKTSNTVYRKEDFKTFSKRYDTFHILVSKWSDISDFDLTDVVVDKDGQKNIEKYRKKHREYIQVQNQYHRSTKMSEEEYFKSVNKLYLLDYSVERYNNVTFGNKTKKTKRFLTTIHRAKGLEFDNVFLSKGCVPLHTDYGSVELRENLYYVALTRAKKNVSCSELYYPYEFTKLICKMNPHEIGIHIDKIPKKYRTLVQLIKNV